ncbi:MAG: VOC family protein [Deltaproteobacteria bacterium]|nr:VOC family protein [Deltaproteobacteria bacterium]
MISHVSLGVRNLSKSIGFYDAVLAQIGYSRLWTTERAAGYGVSGTNEPFALIDVGEALSAAGAGCHIALVAASASAVDAFHRIALQFGAHDNGAPGLRPQYGAGYYAAFIRDLDGHKIEAVHHAEIPHPAKPRSS